jgi:sugar transferase (PEP-CTERM/EpsH1 system associated)
LVSGLLRYDKIVSFSSQGDRSTMAAHRVVRVMHVVYSLRPGGMEFGVVKLVNGLDPSRIESAICSTKPADGLKALLRPEVRVHDLHRRAGNDPALIWQLYRLFRRERPDVVHTHAWGTLIEGLFAARMARVPVVVHGEHGTLQLRPHQRWLQRRGWSAANRVLAVSSRLADRITLETGFPRERISVIRNGVDLSRFGAIERSSARAALGLTSDAQVVATVGRLVPVKDHMTLIEAMALIRRDLNVTLVIAGDGPLRESLAARAAERGIDDRVRFLGHRPDVESVLRAADVFVLSSESEGLSNTILEAMASGLPVVATRVGGADEMVLDGETGVLLPPRSPRELADALESVLNNPARSTAMGAAGRARIEAEFGLQGMLQRYEAMYLDAMGVKSARFRDGNPSRPAVQRSEVA